MVRLTGNRIVRRPRLGDDQHVPQPLPRDSEQNADTGAIKLLLVVSVALVTFVAFEALAVASAMPTVSHELGGEQLYALAYGITLASQVATTPPAGRWCDAGGTRLALITGVATFIVGLVIAGAAPEMWVLVIGRAVQGIGGALVIVPLYVLVGTVVPARRRPGFFAAFSAAWVVPSLVGPVLAGFLAEHASWRWVFLGIAAVALPALFLVLGVLARIGRSDDLPNPDDVPAAPAGGSRGVVWFAIGAGVGAALLQSTGAEPGERGGVTLTDAIAIALALVALAVCVPGLLPRGALRLRPKVPALITGRALLNGSFIGVEVFLVLMLQRQHDWSPMAAGLVLTTGSLSWGAASVVAARVRTETARARLPWIGTALLALGILLVMPSAWPSVPAWLTIVGWVFGGGGIGLAMSASSVLALGWTPRARQGEVSAHLQIADALGAAVLVALTGLAVAVVPLGSSGELPYLAALGIGFVLSVVAATASYRSQGEPAAEEATPMTGPAPSSGL